MMTSPPPTTHHHHHHHPFGSARRRLPKHVSHFSTRREDEGNDSLEFAYQHHCHGDNSSDEHETVDYGYGDTTKTTSTTTTKNNNHNTPPSSFLDFGYNSGGDSVIDYGYGEQPPPTPKAVAMAASLSAASAHVKLPRRSSLKCTGTASQGRRRASISYKGEINVTLPDRSTVRRRVSIGFSDDKNEIKEVEPLTAVVDKESLWVQREEEGINKEKAYMVAEYARRFDAQTLARKRLYIRGLERHMNKRETRESVQAGYCTVLGEQDYQRQRGIFCDEEIGKMYSAAAAYSVEKAQLMAESDYADVKEDHEVIRRMMRRASM